MRVRALPRRQLEQDDAEGVEVGPRPDGAFLGLELLGCRVDERPDELALLGERLPVVLGPRDPQVHQQHLVIAA